jgi:hypothetical protein
LVPDPPIWAVAQRPVEKTKSNAQTRPVFMGIILLLGRMAFGETDR